MEQDGDNRGGRSTEEGSGTESGGSAPPVVHSQRGSRSPVKGRWPRRGGAPPPRSARRLLVSPACPRGRGGWEEATAGSTRAAAAAGRREEGVWRLWSLGEKGAGIEPRPNPLVPPARRWLLPLHRPGYLAGSSLLIGQANSPAPPTSLAKRDPLAQRLRGAARLLSCVAWTAALARFGIVSKPFTKQEKPSSRHVSWPAMASASALSRHGGCSSVRIVFRLGQKCEKKLCHHVSRKAKHDKEVLDVM